MRAVVVDDSKAIRMLLRTIMCDMGFEVAEAADGVEALAHLGGTAPPEVVLVDWNMPNMNGIELVRAMRAESRYDDTRLMMVTTEAEMQNVIASLEAGANEYVMKPFTREVLVDKLAILGLVPTGVNQ